MKRCGKCRVEKSLDDFHRKKASKDGRASYCRECANRAAQEWRARNTERTLKRIQRSEKFCPSCCQEKKIDEFPRNKRRPDGRNSWCKSCANAVSRRWYSENKKSHNEQVAEARRRRVKAGSTKGRDAARDYRKTHAGKTSYELSRRRSDARKRAKKKGIPFDITLGDLLLLWEEQEGKCALTGWPLATAVESNLKNPYLLSIDRIVPDRGYVVGNVRLLCWMVNRAIGEWGQAMFSEMCSLVSKTQEELNG